MVRNTGQVKIAEKQQSTEKLFWASVKSWSRSMIINKAKYSQQLWQGQVTITYLQNLLAEPNVFKTRPISYSIKEAVSKDLDRLETLGVLEKISHLDWAAPVIPVIKPSGAVRIC